MASNGDIDIDAGAGKHHTAGPQVNPFRQPGPRVDQGGKAQPGVLLPQLGCDPAASPGIAYGDDAVGARVGGQRLLAVPQPGSEQGMGFPGRRRGRP